MELARGRKRDEGDGMPTLVSQSPPAPLITARSRRSLLQRSAAMFVVVGASLAAATVLAVIQRWPVVDTGRWSSVILMVVLALFILSPLTGHGLGNRSRSERWNAFMVFWIVISTIFNLVWQVPLTIFRHTITTAEHTHNNLPKFIAWWGYGFADRHYGEVDAWMRSEELWWFLAIVLAVSGLILAARNRRALGYLLMGIGTVLQAYNASLYIVYDVISGMPNIAIRDGLSYALYWGFNPLWTGCALLAGWWSLSQVHLAARQGWSLTNDRDTTGR